MPLVYPVRMAKKPPKKPVESKPVEGVKEPSDDDFFSLGDDAPEELVNEPPKGPPKTKKPKITKAQLRNIAGGKIAPKPAVTYPVTDLPKVPLASPSVPVSEDPEVPRTGSGYRIKLNEEDVLPDDNIVHDTPRVQYPQAPFHEVDSQAYPIGDLGTNASSLLEPEWAGAAGSDPARHFIEATTEGGAARHPMAQRALNILDNAQWNHNQNGSKRWGTGDEGVMRSGIPAGHFRVEPLVPGAPELGHMLTVHHPQGKLWWWRANLNDDNSGYR